MRHLTLVLITLLITAFGFSANETDKSSKSNEKPIRAARFVHLFYKAPDSVLFYNEVKVEQSQKDSYFATCGFSHGYFGIQERKKDKIVIFSVWDIGEQDNPDSVQQDKRVKVLYKDEDVNVSSFGNEGTGGKSIFKYDWQPGQTYKFLVSAKNTGVWTEYSGYFYLNEEKRWKHLVTFSTITDGDVLKGYYSFVEDFRRDVKSVQEMRRAQYGNGWVKTAEGQWISLTRATFTANSSPLMNIDAGVVDNNFYLQTGGSTENTTPLYSKIERLPSGLLLPEQFAPEKKP